MDPPADGNEAKTVTGNLSQVFNTRLVSTMFFSKNGIRGAGGRGGCPITEGLAVPFQSVVVSLGKTKLRG